MKVSLYDSPSDSIVSVDTIHYSLQDIECDIKATFE